MFVPIGSDCALQVVISNAVLAVALCLQNSIKPFSRLPFFSLAFSGPVFSAVTSRLLMSC